MKSQPVSSQSGRPYVSIPSDTARSTGLTCSGQKDSNRVGCRTHSANLAKKSQRWHNGSVLITAPFFEPKVTDDVIGRDAGHSLPNRDRPVIVFIDHDRA